MELIPFVINSKWNSDYHCKKNKQAIDDNVYLVTQIYLTVSKLFLKCL